MNLIRKRRCTQSWMCTRRHLPDILKQVLRSHYSLNEYIRYEKYIVTFLDWVLKVDTYHYTLCHQICLHCTLGSNSIISLHLFYWNNPAHILPCLGSIRLHLSKVKGNKPIKLKLQDLLKCSLSKSFSLSTHRKWNILPMLQVGPVQNGVHLH